MKAKKPPKSGEASPSPPSLAPVGSGFNLLARTARVEVIARIFEQPIVGLPIMREGFVTETGFLPPSGVVHGQQVD